MPEKTLQAAILEHYQDKSPVDIQGGQTRTFIGRQRRGIPLSTSALNRVIDYDPRELVVTVQAGTKLQTVLDLLDQENQMLSFEPSILGEGSTIGGMVATSMAGPRRLIAGGVRDSLLGCRIINGRGEILNFGGRVMKNVAGFDVSRLMAGSHGTLGLILQVSLRVWPKPQTEKTLWMTCNEAEAIETMTVLQRQYRNLSALAYTDSRLFYRVSGPESAVTALTQRIGGDPVEDASAFWTSIRDLQHPLLRTRPLSRIRIPCNTPPLSLNAPALIDWGGALRWYPAAIDQSSETINLPRGRIDILQEEETIYQPLPAPLLQLNKRLKAAFDPHHILNPDRLYPNL
ncbi:MAG: glycolate oxidase subunit GlcE [Gammaproteobacteria bacterium]|nr:MAG: glycolate oxidase subunit GlcE [Gammaproteobacteria bacterium]